MKKVWDIFTYRSKPVKTDKITIRLKGAAQESDGFGQIIEVVEPHAGDMDLLRVKGGEKRIRN